MGTCQRKGCNGIVTGENHTVHPRFEVECNECVERGYKMGIYRLSVQMKPLFGNGQHYKDWTKEHAETIKEGEKLWKH